MTAGHCVEGLDDGRIYWAQSVGAELRPDRVRRARRRPDDRLPVLRLRPRRHVDVQPRRQLRLPRRASRTRRTSGVVDPRRSRTRRRPATTARFRPSARSTATSQQFKSKQDARFVSSGYGLSDQDPRPVSFRERLMANSYLVNDQAPVTDFNLKTTANAVAGQGRDVQRRLGRPDLLRGHQRDRRGDVVRHERRSARASTSRTGSTGHRS